MFPQSLEQKLNHMLEALDQFMLGTGFVYKIEDLDRAEAVRPDLDTSDWLPLNDRKLKRDQGVTWVRASFVVPESCLDVPVAGSQLRVMTETGHAMFAPLEVYIDGKLALSERAWMDFKCPEGIVSEQARSGQAHTVAFRFDFNEKCYWLNNFSLRIISDAVEQNAMHIRSIVEELKYMQGYEGTAEPLSRAYKMLEDAADTGSVLAVRQAEAECRALFEGFRGQVKRNRVYLVGHAHIDMNWFWSMEETREIVARDFATMTNLMDEYPDFKFSQSQCATYDFARTDSPEVFDKIKTRAAEGRWDVTASTWVEGDLNMVQGESLVRHVLYAKQFLKDHFQTLPRIMWCPDTFGHPATMPQILKKTGIDRYYHMRCGLGVGSHEDQGFQSLEDSRQTPVYWWIGPDGSRVLVVNTVYNRTIDTRGILRASQRMNEFACDRAMLAYGVGDHGGGPTRRDIEWVRTIRDFPTVPEIQFATTDEYYGAIEAGGYDLPERPGEMNFVFDGCYTTHADVKRGNRLCEQKLQAAEALCLIARDYGMEYPAEQLRALWKRTLFNQFHDILDGSGVKDTYRFTAREYEDILAQLDELEGAAARRIAERVGTGASCSFVAFNPSGFEASGTVRVAIEDGKRYRAAGLQGEHYPCQIEDGEAIVALENVPAFGALPFSLEEGASDASETHVTGDGKYYHVTTKYYEIEIQKDNGQITTLYDRENDWYVVRRETIGWRLKKGVLNALQVHMEEPTEMSGWTIGNIRDVHTLLSGAASRVIADGASEIRIRFEHRFMESEIRLDIVIQPDSRVIRFEAEIDWKEWGDFDRDAPMLKVYFAPDVQNTGAAYEVPFGVVTRPADDREYPALGWVDVSDGAHGFALLNDCKHGHRCRGNALELTLIRSGWLPDQKSDVGAHKFTYAILPHMGCWREAGVPAAAQALNRPLIAEAALGCGAGFSLASLESGAAILSGVKLSEDGKDLIARVYNPTETAAEAVLMLGFDASTVTSCDLLENPEGEGAPISGRKLALSLKPYEILTLRVAR